MLAICVTTGLGPKIEGEIMKLKLAGLGAVAAVALFVALGGGWESDGSKTAENAGTANGE